MKLLKEVFSILVMKKNRTEKDSFIYYKIVNFNQSENVFALQCLHSSSVFYASINEIVFDKDILCGLHPAQACYIGIEYARQIIKQKQPYDKDCSTELNPKKFASHRYGLYCLTYQDRKGNLCFTNSKTGQIYLMDPCHIALSEELINEFDSTQAFHIGFFAGLKLNKIICVDDEEPPIEYVPPKLKILK